MKNKKVYKILINILIAVSIVTIVLGGILLKCEYRQAIKEKKRENAERWINGEYDNYDYSKEY